MSQSIISKALKKCRNTGSVDFRQGGGRKGSTTSE